MPLFISPDSQSTSVTSVTSCSRGVRTHTALIVISVCKLIDGPSSCQCAARSCGRLAGPGAAGVKVRGAKPADLPPASLQFIKRIASSGGLLIKTHYDVVGASGFAARLRGSSQLSSSAPLLFASPHLPFASLPECADEQLVRTSWPRAKERAR